MGAAAVAIAPPRLRYAAAGAGGALWYAASVGQRRAARQNYAAVLGRDPSSPEVAAVARQAFANYGRMLADFALLERLTRDELVERCDFVGLENADAALAGGRGALIVLPHMGSWDLAGSAAAARGYPLSVVAERFPGSLNDAVVATRARFGMAVLPTGRAAVGAIRQALEAGRAVCLVCDLQQGPGVEVSFFGRRAIVPAGPAAFAARSGVPVVPLWVEGVEDGRYRAHIEPALAPEDLRAGDRPASTRDVMQAIIRRFEGYIRAHPAQWYAFRPMFS